MNGLLKLFRRKGKLEQLREMHAIQGADGNWDVDGYMCGLFNGLEMALAVWEGRESIFRTLKRDGQIRAESPQ
jgi:hypothetical protein